MNNTQQLVVDNMDLAKKMARKKSRSLSHISYDDLESAAYFGLVDAASKYIPEQNDNFKAYASIRIAGAICDYLRELQWGSRSSPVKIEVYEDHAVEAKQEDCELFDKLDKILPVSGCNVIRRYYADGQKIQEIATAMGVNESRVSQILSDSRSRLKQSWLNCESDLWAEVA